MHAGTETTLGVWWLGKGEAEEGGGRRRKAEEGGADLPTVAERGAASGIGPIWAAAMRTMRRSSPAGGPTAAAMLLGTAATGQLEPALISGVRSQSDSGFAEAVVGIGGQIHRNVSGKTEPPCRIEWQPVPMSSLTL